jgi:hypothetical protein
MYSKADLYYNDYVWTTRYNKDDPRVTGEPDSTLLARREGWEMLYFLNKCAEKWGWKSKDVATIQKVEKLIRNYVPSSTRSQKGIKEWLEANWVAYKDKV